MIRDFSRVLNVGARADARAETVAKAITAFVEEQSAQAIRLATRSRLESAVVKGHAQLNRLDETVHRLDDTLSGTLKLARNGDSSALARLGELDILLQKTRRTRDFFATDLQLLEGKAAELKVHHAALESLRAIG